MAFQLEQEKCEALARGSLHTHSTVVEESLLAGLGMAGATSLDVGCKEQPSALSLSKGA